MPIRLLVKRMGRCVPARLEQLARTAIITYLENTAKKCPHPPNEDAGLYMLGRRGTYLSDYIRLGFPVKRTHAFAPAEPVETDSKAV